MASTAIVPYSLVVENVELHASSRILRILTSVKTNRDQLKRTVSILTLGDSFASAFVVISRDTYKYSR